MDYKVEINQDVKKIWFGFYSVLIVLFLATGLVNAGKIISGEVGDNLMFTYFSIAIAFYGCCSVALTMFKSFRTTIEVYRNEKIVVNNGFKIQEYSFSQLDKPVIKGRGSAFSRGKELSDDVDFEAENPIFILKANNKVILKLNNGYLNVDEFIRDVNMYIANHK